MAMDQLYTDTLRELEKARARIAYLERENANQKAVIDMFAEQEGAAELERQVLGLRGALQQLQGASSEAVRNHVEKALTDTAQAGRDADVKAESKAVIRFVDFCIAREHMPRSAMEIAFMHFCKSRLRTEGERR